MYYIVVFVDEIYVDFVSLVGLIGVISDGFGFVEVIDKLGVECWVFNVGVNKVMLDLF